MLSTTLASLKTLISVSCELSLPWSWLDCDVSRGQWETLADVSGVGQWFLIWNQPLQSCCLKHYPVHGGEKEGEFCIRLTRDEFAPSLSYTHAPNEYPLSNSASILSCLFLPLVYSLFYGEIFKKIIFSFVFFGWGEVARAETWRYPEMSGIGVHDVKFMKNQ